MGRMRKCGLNGCDELTDTVYCSNSCKGKAKSEFNAKRRLKKFGEGWDKPRKCLNKDCNTLIEVENYNRVALFRTAKYHSRACMVKCLNEKSPDPDINKKTQAARARQSRLKLDEKAELRAKAKRVRDSMRPEMFEGLNGCDLIAHLAITGKTLSSKLHAL